MDSLRPSIRDDASVHQLRRSPPRLNLAITASEPPTRSSLSLVAAFLETKRSASSTTSGGELWPTSSIRESAVSSLMSSVRRLCFFLRLPCGASHFLLSTFTFSTGLCSGYSMQLQLYLSQATDGSDTTFARRKMLPPNFVPVLAFLL